MVAGMRVVMTSFGSYGDVYPYIGLAKGLRDRGHHPVLAMPAYYRGAVASEGLEFHPVRPDVDPSDTRLIGRVMHAGSGSEFLVRQLILPALRESVADLTEAVRGADLLITHPITFAGPLIAERDRMPWISTVLAPISFFSTRDMPVFPPMPWIKRLEPVPGLARGMLGITRRITHGWTEPVRALRRELGLPDGANPLLEGQHSPERVLALFSRVLMDPQADWPPNVTVTGAIPYNGPDVPDPLSSELEAFLEAGPPPVVFTLGSSAVGAAGGFYEESLEAVRRLGVRAVMLIGSHPSNRPRVAPPDGVLFQEFARHAALFPRATAVVHQGGAGTLHQALRAGRPTLVVPFAHDQPDNAYRVERLGISRTVRASRYRARRVERVLADLLADGSYRARAAHVGQRVREEDGVRAACDAIEATFGTPAG